MGSKRRLQRAFERRDAAGGFVSGGDAASAYVEQDRDRQERYNLVAAGRVQIKRLLAAYLGSGGARPAAIAIDLRDQVGRELAEQIQGREKVAEEVEDSKLNTAVPVTALVVPQSTASRLLATFSPRMSRTLAEVDPGDGMIFVASIGHGVTSMMAGPIEMFLSDPD